MVSIIRIPIPTGPKNDPRLRDDLDRAHAQAMAMAHTHMRGADAINHPNQRWNFAQAMASAQQTTIRAALQKARQKALLAIAEKVKKVKKVTSNGIGSGSTTSTSSGLSTTRAAGSRVRLAVDDENRQYLWSCRYQV